MGDSNSTIGMRQYGDVFSDVVSDLSGFGSLAGAAMNKHERADAQVKREGVHMHAACDNCGAHNVVIAEWPEVIFIATGRIPPVGWKLDQGYVRTDMGCRGCNRLLPIGVLPDEAGKWTRAAISAQYVSPQTAEGIAAQARAMR